MQGGRALTSLPRLLPRPFLHSLAIRVTLAWVLLRGAVSVGSSTLSPHPVVGVFLTPIVVVALWFDMSRQSELVFLANLGHSFLRIATFIVIQCLALEAILALIVA